MDGVIDTLRQYTSNIFHWIQYYKWCSQENFFLYEQKNIFIHCERYVERCTMTTQDYNTPFRYWMKSKMFMRKKRRKTSFYRKFLAKVAFIYNGSFLSCYTTVYILCDTSIVIPTFMYTFEVHIVMNNVSLTSFPKKVINLIPLYCINCAHYKALYSILWIYIIKNNPLYMVYTKVENGNGKIIFWCFRVFNFHVFWFIHQKPKFLIYNYYRQNAMTDWADYSLSINK